MRSGSSTGAGVSPTKPPDVIPVIHSGITAPLCADVQAHEEPLVLDVPVPGARVLQVGVVPDLQVGRLLPVLRPAGCVARTPRGKARRKARSGARGGNG